MQYSETKFDLPSLEGLSKESVDAHLGLYSGYVKNFNQLAEVRGELMRDPEKNAHAIAEITRRISFEFDGMRLHEYYFSQWEKGVKTLSQKSDFAAALAKQFGSISDWEKQFRSVASMRGPGWAILYFDPRGNFFHNAWIEQHHQGHFATLPVIVALDVWEHAFVKDYGVAGRGKYIEACFKNYNWSVMEERFSSL
ncbi:MAG: superoxide dismutase [Patescibacteria group bacterium]|nr:superoxide dismutase [Patescibacteria group bacterium]